MNILTFFPYYIFWHYSQGISDLYQNLIRFIQFLYSWFSISHLCRTFFSPWKRLDEAHPTGFHPEDLLSSLLVNAILRILGMTVRFFVILSGLIAMFFGVVLSILVFLLWILFPAVVFFLVAIILKHIL